MKERKYTRKDFLERKIKPYAMECKVLYDENKIAYAYSLHGNPILFYGERIENGYKKISLLVYPMHNYIDYNGVYHTDECSKTTKERINSILAYHGLNLRLIQDNFKIYLMVENKNKIEVRYQISMDGCIHDYSKLDIF